MSDQVLTSYGANRLVLARATAMADVQDVGRLAAEPFSDFTALTSCWLEPSGSAELILIPYVFSKVLMMVP